MRREIVRVVRRTWAGRDEFSGLQPTSNVKIVPDLIQRLIVASDCNISSVAFFESIFYLGQRVRAIMRGHNSGFRQELLIVSFAILVD
jgi:hypothetical protein